MIAFLLENPVSDGYSIQFDKLPWEPVSEFARQKRIPIQNRIVRLLNLDEGIQELEWCRKSHIAYVIDGELRIDFVDRSETVRSGDGLMLIGGEDGKHKAAVVRGPVTLFLVESA